MESRNAHELLAGQALTKRNRFEAVLKLVEQAPAAADAEEANQLVSRAFKDVEKAAGMQEMYVYEFNSYHSFPRAGKNIYFQEYKRHTIFLGVNGAIDIRLNDSNYPLSDLFLRQQPNFPKEKLQPVFEKPGADGQGVWD